MAQFAVQYLFYKLTTLLEEKVNLARGVKQEVEYVKGELERMVAFLRVADAMEESDAEVKVWVKQVRDVAYDTEDIIDKFMLHQRYNEHGHGLCCIFDKLLLSIRNLKIKYRVASEIQSIQSRVRDIAEGHQRYRFKANIPEQGSGGACATDIGNDRRGDALLLEEWELVGVDEHKRELISFLVAGSPALEVISVYGMGGLGKTTLVKKVFDDTAVKKHFYSHAWTSVSKSFKIEEILKDLIQQFYAEVKQPLPEGMSAMNTNRLKATLKQFLRQRKYVLVFDDVWSIQAWEAIKYALPSGNHGSRVIQTTRFTDVASFSTIENSGHADELKALSDDASWILFCRKTFRDKSCPLHLREISKNILKRCGGLPLAIVAIGGVLATKNQSIDEWRMLNHNFGVGLEDNDTLESMRIILLLSFNDLPYYLKPCFLYLSIYPEDHLIESNTLIRLWIAEGFVKDKEGRTVEEVGVGYLNELVNRSLIQAVKYHDDGSVKLSRIHDLYREIILQKSRDQNFTTIASDQSMVWTEKIRRLSIIHPTFKDANVNRYCTGLRSLLAFGVKDSSSMSCVLQLLTGCRMLKVLVLRGVPLNKFPEEVTKLLCLGYLSLRDTQLAVLPGSIKKLRQLEVLDVKQTCITKLPPEILELQNLRQLLAYRTLPSSYLSYDVDRTAPYSSLPYDCTHGFEALNGIGQLRSLQKLCYIEANGASDIFRQIEMLSELRRLGILKLRREDGRDVCLAIEKLHNLCSLTLKSKVDEILDIGYLSSPPLFLQRLYLTGRLFQFPHWIRSLHSLVRIYIRWTQLKEDPLEYLQDLPNLVHLELLVAYTGDTLCFRAGKFQKLKLLDLDKLEALRWVMIEEGAMPKLEKFLIQRCNLLQRVPAGIERLTELQVLEFFDMPVEFTLALRPEKLGEDYSKVAHIPQVYYTFWNDGGWQIHPVERNCEDENSGQAPAALMSYD